MSPSTLGMMSDTSSGSVTSEQSICRDCETSRQSAKNLRDATERMWRSVKAIPADIQNIVYRFTSYEGRYRESLLGPWPRIAASLARSGAPLADVMSPAYEVAAQLKREVYRKSLPSLEVIEQEEAEVVCKIQKAEIKHDLRSLKEAAREEMIVAELLEEVADRESHGSLQCK